MLIIWYHREAYIKATQLCGISGRSVDADLTVILILMLIGLWFEMVAG